MADHLVEHTSLPQISSYKNQISYRAARAASSADRTSRDEALAAVNDDGVSEKNRSADGKTTTWGRMDVTGWLGAAGCLSIVMLCPAMVIFYCITLEHQQGSIFASISALWKQGVYDYVVKYAPVASWNALLGYSAWLAFQIALFTYLPGPLSIGQLTPAGHLLKYTTNGLLAWVVTHVTAVVLVMAGLLDPALLAKNWGGLLIAANVYGYLLSAFSYIKAHRFPTHALDRKFSGSYIYDFYMGIELNPRIGKLGDFKLFTNGRPGIVAWTLIDLSFTAWQYQLHGYVTSSMIIVDILHAFYVVDFFINEDWYLRTIDIAHDHFGFYLAWGSLVWLPAIYTLQTQYLARYPVHLPPVVAAAILLTGLSGYVIFRCVNYQKDIVRRSDGNCMIWGKPAEYVRCTFKTKDGKTHESLLLTSGWWGVARQANYLGDLILSYSMCAVSGLNNILPWTYAIFMTILLVHRINRNEMRCRGKYGKDWDLYCEKVKWKLVPGIF